MIKDQNSDITSSLWNAIFERILFSFWLEISNRNFNEFEFSNCIRTYFRFLESIESINKRQILLVFFHFRLYLIENIFNQILCLLQSIEVLRHWCYWCCQTQCWFWFVRISLMIIVQDLLRMILKIFCWVSSFVWKMIDSNDFILQFFIMISTV
jgi:hypothetical protein